VVIGHCAYLIVYRCLECLFIGLLMHEHDQ